MIVQQRVQTHVTHQHSHPHPLLPTLWCGYLKDNVYMCKDTPHEASQGETEKEHGVVPVGVVVGLMQVSCEQCYQHCR